ncbi:Protein of unknown function [Gryllus bimaculatus]|nr:Protein of unknown function [Gryllus bimaculatus]
MLEFWIGVGAVREETATATANPVRGARTPPQASAGRKGDPIECFKDTLLSSRTTDIYNMYMMEKEICRMTELMSLSNTEDTATS